MAGIQTSKITTAAADDLVIDPATGKQVQVKSVDATNPGETPVSVDADGTVKRLDVSVLTELSDPDAGDFLVVQAGTARADDTAGTTVVGNLYKVDGDNIGGGKPADPETGDISASPAFLGGDGSAINPYVVTPATVDNPGGSTVSLQTITISNQKTFVPVPFTDLTSGAGNRFAQPGQTTDATGTVSFNLQYVDAPSTTPGDGQTYNGSIKVGTTSVYFKWDVTQIANKTVIDGPNGEVAPGASPLSVDYPADSKFGKGSGTWEDGNSTLTATGDVVFGTNSSVINSSSKSISNGQTITVGFDEAAVNSAAEGATIEGALDSGAGYYQTFSMVKRTNATPFTIQSLVDQPKDSVVTSGNNPIKGITAKSSLSLVSATLTDVEVSVQGGAWTSLAVGGSVDFNPGDSLQARGTTGSGSSTTYNAVFSVGTTQATWEVTTVDVDPEIAQPVITSPVNGSTGVAPPVTLVGSTYTPLEGAGPHESSDWEFYEGTGLEYPTSDEIIGTDIIAIGDDPVYAAMCTYINDLQPDPQPYPAHLAMRAFTAEGFPGTFAGSPPNPDNVDPDDWTGSNMIFTPETPIPYSSSLKIYAANAGRNGVYVNGNWVAFGNHAQEHAINGAGSLESIQWGYAVGERTSNYTLLKGIEIDGVPLISSLPLKELEVDSTKSLSSFESGDAVISIPGDETGIVHSVTFSGFNGATKNAILVEPIEEPWNIGAKVMGEAEKTVSDPPTTEPPDPARYTKVIDSRDDTANKTTYEVGSGVIQPGKFYFSRVKYHDNGSTGSTVSSEFSNYNTFEGASGDFLIAKPAWWVKNELGETFGTKPFINPFWAHGHWGGAAKDGTATFVGQGTDPTHWITDPDGFGYVQASMLQGIFILLRSDGTLLMDKDTLDNTGSYPTDASNFQPIDTDVVLYTTSGEVLRGGTFVKKDGTVRVLTNTDTGTVGTLGGVSVTAFTPATIPFVLPFPEKVVQIAGMSDAGMNYHIPSGYLLLTDAGNVYIAGMRNFNGNETGGTAAAPLNVTPVGEKFRKVCHAGGLHRPMYGVHAVSDSGKLYGMYDGSGYKHGPHPKVVPYTKPLTLIDGDDGYIHSQMGYPANATAIYRQTEAEGLQWANAIVEGGPWTDLPGSNPGTGDLWGAFGLNCTGSNRLANILMPREPA